MGYKPPRVSSRGPPGSSEAAASNFVASNRKSANVGSSEPQSFKDWGGEKKKMFLFITV